MRDCEYHRAGKQLDSIIMMGPRNPIINNLPEIATGLAIKSVKPCEVNGTRYGRVTEYSNL